MVNQLTSEKFINDGRHFGCLLVVTKRTSFVTTYFGLLCMFDCCDQTSLKTSPNILARPNLYIILVRWLRTSPTDSKRTKQTVEASWTALIAFICSCCHDCSRAMLISNFAIILLVKGVLTLELTRVQKQEAIELIRCLKLRLLSC